MHQLLGERLTLGPPPEITGGKHRPGRRARPRLRARPRRRRRRPRAVAERRRLQHGGGAEGMSFDPSGLTVYLDGEYVPGGEARLPIWDHGLLYGDGIFEGMRLFSGSLFRPVRPPRAARRLGARARPGAPARRRRPARRDLPGDRAVGPRGRPRPPDRHPRLRRARSRPGPLRARLARRRGLPVPAASRERPDQRHRQLDRAQGAALGRLARQVAQLHRRRPCQAPGERRRCRRRRDARPPRRGRRVHRREPVRGDRRDARHADAALGPSGHHAANDPRGRRREGDPVRGARPLADGALHGRRRCS